MRPLCSMQVVIIVNGTVFIYRTRKLMMSVFPKAVKLLVANHATCLPLLFPPIIPWLQKYLSVGELSRPDNEFCVLDGTDTAEL